MDLEENEVVGVKPLHQLVSQFGDWQLLNPEDLNTSDFLLGQAGSW